eukprot:EG_transcript_24348
MPTVTLRRLNCADKCVPNDATPSGVELLWRSVVRGPASQALDGSSVSAGARQWRQGICKRPPRCALAVCSVPVVPSSGLALLFASGPVCLCRWRSRSLVGLTLFPPLATKRPPGAYSTSVGGGLLHCDDAHHGYSTGPPPGGSSQPAGKGDGWEKMLVLDPPP